MIGVTFILTQSPLIMADDSRTLSDWYLAASLGTGSFDDGKLVSGGTPYSLDLESSVAGGLALGYHFRTKSSTVYRGEVELWRFRPDIDRYNGTAISVDSGSSLNITALMNNGFINFGTNHQLSPYIGAGAGIASVEIDAATANQSDDFVWSYQLLAGLDFKPESYNNLRLSIGYRLFFMEDAKYYFGRLEGEEIHAASLGVRYSF